MNFQEKIVFTFKRAGVFIRAFFILKNFKAAYLLSMHPQHFNENIKNKIRWNKGRFLMMVENIQLSVKNFHQLQGDFNLLFAVGKFGTINIQDGDLVIELPVENKSVFFFIYRHEVLDNIREVIIDRIYAFEGLKEKQHVVMDVGMNVGVASLYFASMDNVKKIFGYEPLKVNLDMAKRNFEKNPEISEKIVINNFGLDSADAELELPFAHPGDMGFSTSGFMIEKTKSKKVIEGRIERIKIVNIGKEFSLIKNKFPGISIMLKLDCEGAEYTIIQYLSDNSLLETVSMIAIEWHYKGPELLVDLLEKNNFKVIHMEDHSNNYTGMIKAERISGN